jgi:hypothetical protein
MLKVINCGKHSYIDSRELLADCLPDGKAILLTAVLADKSKAQRPKPIQNSASQATSEQQGLAISIADNPIRTPHTYSAKQIAIMHGIYSLYGNPHPQAVSCILNQKIFIKSEHKYILTSETEEQVDSRIRYDEYAAKSVKDWIVANKHPREIYGFDCAFHVLYVNRVTNLFK